MPNKRLQIEVTCMTLEPSLYPRSWCHVEQTDREWWLQLSHTRCRATVEAATGSIFACVPVKKTVFRITATHLRLRALPIQHSTLSEEYV